jgi:tetratricopeptide (TPR) repeat protein
MRFLLGVVLLLASARVCAEESEAGAKRLYDKAQLAFEAARYDQALDGYTRAYRLAPYPAILYRMALSHDLLGRREEAARLYERYLVEDPLSKRREAVQARLFELRRPAPSAPAAELRQSPQPLPDAPPSRARPSATAAPAAGPGPSAERSGGRRLWIAGAVLGVAGLALAGAGGAMTAQLADATAQLDALFRSGGTFDDAAQAQNRRRS